VWCSLVTTAIAAAGLVLTMAIKSTPWLPCNLSASAAIGLYRLQRAGNIVINDAAFLAQGGYLPRGVPLLKRVRALGGQTVCRIAYEITMASRSGRHSNAITGGTRFPINNSWQMIKCS
jgi:type IV secretory pathway protease TraF